MSNIYFKNKQLAFSIISLSIMLILSYIEAIIPLNIGSIGIRIGLSNILTILCIKKVGIKYSFIINILRLIIIGMVFNNMVRFAISLSGFILSFIIMSILIKVLGFSIISSSIFGGVSHNIGQIVCVSILSQSVQILRLIPIYIIIGVFTGLFVGILTNIIYKKLKLFQ